jgi:hypothetical protein
MSDPTASTQQEGAASAQQKGNAWTRDQALTLFRKYEDQGWAVKQQMLAIFGLLTPVIFGLIAYCVKNYFSKEAPEATTAAGWTAFFLSVFMAALIFISLLHANNDYTRSQKVLDDSSKKKLLPDEILEIMLDKEGQRRSSLLLLLLPQRWRNQFCYIGWQFIAIMYFALLLVLVSFLVAFRVTLSAV